MVTISDVAKAAGVSKASVSYALSGSNKVSEKTRERILKIIDEINYIPNKNARILRNGKSMKAGLFLTFFSGSYFMYLTESIYRTFDLAGYSLDVHILKCSSPQEMISEIVSSDIDTAIVFYRFENPKNEELLVQILSDRGIPVVFLSSENSYPHASSVIMNNVSDFSMLAEYLYESGHRKIIYIGGFDNYDEIKRYEGLKNGLSSHNIDVWKVWNYTGSDPSEWVAYQAVRANFPLLTELPDAICCANDPLAIGCINALQDFGYSVPKDISVTGFDDLIPAKLCGYKLTTANNPVARIGKIASEEALRLMNPDEEGKKIVVDSKLLKGETVAIRVQNT